MDDRVGLGLEDGLPDGAGVEQVEGDRPGSEGPHALGALGRRRGADHLVAAIDQLGDEPGADRTARSGDKDSHRVLLSSHSRGFAGLLL